MKTLFVAYRVTDLDRSPGSCTALGYVELGRVEVGDGTHLVILKFPGEPAASLELVHRPASARIDAGSGVDHRAIQVDKLATTLQTLAQAGLEPEPVQYPGGPSRSEDVVAYRPGRLPDQVGGMAVPTSRRHHAADFS